MVVGQSSSISDNTLPSFASMDLWEAIILKVKAGLLLMDLERGGNGSVGSTRGLKDVNNAVIVVCIYFF